MKIVLMVWKVGWRLTPAAVYGYAAGAALHGDINNALAAFIIASLIAYAYLSTKWPEDYE